MTDQQDYVYKEFWKETKKAWKQAAFWLRLSIEGTLKTIYGWIWRL